MKDRLRKYIRQLLEWRASHIPKKQLIIILSMVVGFISGFVAVSLKNTTHFIQNLVQSGYFTDYFNFYYFVFPVIGIIIALFIKSFFKGPVGEGIPSTLYAISKRNGLLKPYRMYASFLTSVFTVGFGGSVGLEGPTVGTGSAIGSNIGRLAHLNFKSRVLLISCATAGAIASIFNAPIAAIIFTIEIFGLDLTFSSLIPLLLASVSGAVTSIFFQGNDFLFHFNLIDDFRVSEVPYFVILGILTALCSVYFNKVYFAIDSFFSKMKSKTNKVVIGGGLLGLLIFIIPPLYGEGYETINAILDGDTDSILEQCFFIETGDSAYWILLMIFGLLMLKVFAASFTIGAGGVGGVFAPTLFIGSSLGYVFSRLINELQLGSLATSHYALVGMAGLMAGVLHAPLTAIFMIAEITGGYQLFIPLMIVSATSFLVTRQIMPFSIYTRQLAQRGELITHDKDKAILTLLNLDAVIESNFKSVSPELSLGDLVKVVSSSKRNLFPVLNKEEELKGILLLDDFRNIMFDTDLYNTITVGQLMSPAPDAIERTDTMDIVMKKFQKSNAWNLPVVTNGKYVGFVSKSQIFSVYRTKLIEFSE